MKTQAERIKLSNRYLLYRWFCTFAFVYKFILVYRSKLRCIQCSKINIDKWTNKYSSFLRTTDDWRALKPKFT